MVGQVLRVTMVGHMLRDDGRQLLLNSAKRPAKWRDSSFLLVKLALLDGETRPTRWWRVLPSQPSTMDGWTACIVIVFLGSRAWPIVNSQIVEIVFLGPGAWPIVIVFLGPGAYGQV